MALSDLIYHDEVLPNGMRVVLVRHPAAQAVKIKLVVRVGTFYETRTTAGLSHLVEHLLLQQASLVPRPSGYLDDWNGSTHNVTTEFRLTSSKGRLHAALADLRAWVDHPPLDPGHLEAARASITAEFASYSCDEVLHRRLFEVARKRMYRNAPGTTETMELHNTRRLSQQQVASFFQQHYGAQNLALCLIGDVETSCTKIVHELFDSLPGGSSPKLPVLQLRTLPWIYVNRTFHKPARCLLTFVVTGDRAASFSDRSFVDFWMLERLLEGRLKWQLCGELGWLHDCKVEYRATPQTGFFDVEIDGGSRQVYLSIQRIVEEIQRLLNEELSDEELKYYRRRLHDECLKIYSSLDRLEDEIGVREVYGFSTGPLQELNRKLQMVDKGGLLDLARRTFRRDAVVLVILSPRLILKERAFRKAVSLLQ